MRAVLAAMAPFAPLVFVLVPGPVGCAAEREPIERAAVESVAERAADPERLALAFRLAEIAPLRSAPPPPERFDASDPMFWRAAAFAYAPQVREARHAYVAAIDAARAAGAPGPARIDADGPPLAVAVEIDFLGVLGVGRSRAENALARDSVRAALGALEQAVFSADFDVERARIRVLAELEAVAAIERLTEPVRTDATRITILVGDGFVPRATADEALGQVRALQAAVDRAHVQLAAARADLARLAGLPPDHPAFATLTGALPEEPIAPAAPDASTLIARIPELRRLRLDYAVAEADVRLAAARWWPELAVGPQVVAGDDFLPGGVLRMDVSWPTTVLAGMRAAAHRRERAREMVEETLIDWQARRMERVARVAAAVRLARDLAPAIDAGAEAMWRAARARFSTDPAALPEWSLALERRMPAIDGLIEARRNAALAAIDVRELDGVEFDGGAP